MDYFYKGKAIKKNAPVSWIAKADSLAANTNLVCVEDVDNKKNSVLSATAFFSAFTSLTVAHGYQKNYGNWCVVDGTNITTYYGTSATQMSQVAHGLTISDFLTVIIKQKTTQNAEITIMTKEGQFTTATIPHWHGSNGDVLMCGAQAMTNAELSYGLSDTNTDVFLFVDSYGTEGDVARVPRQIQNLGYTAFLACGHGGGNSAQTYPQFEKLIELAQPKICVWMIGMNDPDSSTAINATWKSYAEQFAATCEARGIIPVFTVIPNVPNYRHTFKNDWIKASGHRYVDWAQAVGAEEAGSSWYTGMLAGGNDNVHPTELGAKALAMRTVLDVPELANVSKFPTKTSDLINDSIKTPYYLTVTDNGGTITVDKTPAEIDALSVDGYDVHMRLPMTLGQLTSVADMRFFAALGVALFYGVAWYGSSPLIAVARVTDQKLVSYELTETARMTDIPTSVSELTNDSGYQTASDVQTAIAAIPAELPAVTASDNGKFLRVVSGAWAAEPVSTWQGGSY